MDNLDKLKLFTTQTTAFEILKAWKDKSPNNVDLKKVIHCFDVMFHYEKLMELQVDDMKRQYAQMLDDKNKQIMKLKSYTNG
jgi:hypothetical protein